MHKRENAWQLLIIYESKTYSARYWKKNANVSHPTPISRPRPGLLRFEFCNAAWAQKTRMVALVGYQAENKV